ncbi:hypothetical protein BH24CHL7_BH24CHL7_03880 [soil metagenome]
MSTADEPRVPWRLGRRPALDGVRGLAVLLVLVGHAMPPEMASAAVGVNLFFVLSGFLITSLLWEEWQGTGRLDIHAFYKRRIRRLIPALVVMLGVTMVSMGLIGQAGQGLFYGLAAASYAGNLVMATGQWLGPMSHTWSLAIEEQFYLLWPLILLPAIRRVRPALLMGILATGVIAVQIARPFLWATGASFERVSFATDLQADGLLLGCALAVLMHFRTIRVPQLAAPIAFGTLLTLTFVSPAGLHLALGNSLAVLASGLLVLTLVSPAAATDRIFTNTWLRRLGLISYGLYLWHYPVMWHLGFFDERPHPGLATAALGIAVTLAAAMASYLFVERRFMRPKSPPVVPRTVPAPVSLPAAA